MGSDTSTNAFRCDQCGVMAEEKANIQRFSYELVDGKKGVEMFYLCGDCNSLLPKRNPMRRAKLVQIFQSMHPGKYVVPDDTE
jgi:ribosomal protein S26